MTQVLSNPQALGEPLGNAPATSAPVAQAPATPVRGAGRARSNEQRWLSTQSVLILLELTRGQFKQVEIAARFGVSQQRVAKLAAWAKSHGYAILDHRTSGYSLAPQRRREIARAGGQAVQALGKAHSFNSESGKAARAKNVAAHQFTPDEARAAGKKGAAKRWRLSA